MKNIIGFAEQFYTLWNYEKENIYKTDVYGNSHQSGVDHKYCYVKSISKDLGKVKSLFPNVEIDMQLRGNCSFFRRQNIDLPENYFWFGKYAGNLIDDIIYIDFPYCLWVSENYNNAYIRNHQKYIAHFEAIAEKEKSAIANAEKVSVGDVVELTFSRNGCFDDDNVCLTFAKLGETELKVRCSGGKNVNGLYPYIMPMINGKFQRTKGKKIQVEVLNTFKTTILDGVVFQEIEIN